MKAEHRHELQTNELAAWLENSIEQLKPYSRLILGVVVAALIILGVYFYVTALQRRGEAEASAQYTAALNNLSMSGDQDLKDVVERYRGTQPAALAQLVLAEAQLGEGTNEQYTNMPVAREKLSRAAGNFVTAEQATHDPMLRAWALFGQGRAYESMGNLERARSAYENLVRDYPDSALVDSARSHLDHLDRKSIKEFYDWFAKQDPRPPAMDKETGIPGVKPSFDLSEPSSASDVKLPSATDSNKSNETKPTGETPSGGVSLPPMQGTPADSKSNANSKAPADAK